MKLLSRASPCQCITCTPLHAPCSALRFRMLSGSSAHPAQHAAPTRRRPHEKTRLFAAAVPVSARDAGPDAWFRQKEDLWESVHSEEEFVELLAAHKEKLVLVDFWATWCKGCEKVCVLRLRCLCVYWPVNGAATRQLGSHRILLARQRFSTSNAVLCRSVLSGALPTGR